MVKGLWAGPHSSTASSKPQVTSPSRGAPPTLPSRLALLRARSVLAGAFAHLELEMAQDSCRSRRGECVFTSQGKNKRAEKDGSVTLHKGLMQLHTCKCRLPRRPAGSDSSTHRMLFHRNLDTHTQTHTNTHFNSGLSELSFTAYLCLLPFSNSCLGGAVTCTHRPPHRRRGLTSGLGTRGSHDRI